MSLFYTVSMILVVALSGVLLAVTPILMKHDEVFAVTVPSAHYRDHELAVLRQQYMSVVLALTAVGSIAIAFASMSSEAVFTVVFLVALLVVLGGSFLFYLRSRRRVMEIKKARGWEQAVENVAVAVMGQKTEIKPLSLWWNAVYIPIIIATVAVGVVLYPQVAAQVPIHTNLSGEVTRYASKTYSIIFFAPVIQAFLAILMTFVSWMIGRARKAVDADHPQASSRRSAQFTRAWSILILVMGIVLLLSLGTIQLATVGIISLETSGMIALAGTGIILIAVVVASVKYGQSGARLAPKAEEGDTIARDDDRYWKLGVIYFNPGDPALFVPKRFGIGWTGNLARPLMWVIAGGLLVFIIALVVVSFQLS